MSTGNTVRDLDFHSDLLPRGTFARSIFDNRLVQLSDRGGASQLIGSAWSDVAARVLDSWVDGPVPADIPSLVGSRVTAVHRLDTVPGVARRASKAGLKNPDFVVFATHNGQQTVCGVDAKFSIETARPVQVSAETTAQLFEQDEHLISLLPDLDRNATYEDGFFLSPDYSLTHAMFRQKIGHRRLTVSPQDVVLADVQPDRLFEGIVSRDIVSMMVAMDALTFPVWESLLASQYYFRLGRSIVGLVAEEQKPLLGTSDLDASEDDLIARVQSRPGTGEGAWQMILDWDRDVERVRRQRQALHQVVGTPLSGPELRDLSDEIMDAKQLDRRPSRNQIRKTLGALFTADVIEEVGVILPPVDDFSRELERVAAAARKVSERYEADMRGIVAGIIEDLAGR